MNIDKLVRDITKVPVTKSRTRKLIKDFINKIHKEQPFPRIMIERWGEDDDGHIEFIDLHDEKFGEAIFFQDGSRHRHGFLNDGKYD